ncbi:MAG: addiction module protein [Saprospirales bacterium]|nr:addiction module protein [Saprospirales bacterium]MBK8351046.1 addiction module protein [Saprospirales bacterium]
MPTLTITIDKEENSVEFKKLLNGLDYVTEVEEYEDVNQEIKDVLEERWKEYKKNPKSVISLEQFKQNMKDKFGYEV